MEEIKRITIPIITKESKSKKNRVVTQTSKWIQNVNVLNSVEGEETNTSLIHQQIQQKLSGYRQQDLKKKHLVPEKFVDLEFTIQLLKDANNQCFYCKQVVQVLYEKVREPQQWSLDRIDNNCGHNKDNVLLACLDCNLKRKTMYHERYAFTKQLNISKI
jgi:hypothetical protein